MKLYGLIGKSLGHSFSKNYFEKKFAQLELSDCAFVNYELQSIDEFLPLLAAEKNVQGLSVTIPYKESILPFLDELSPEAETIAAVNCIQFKNGKKIGHNTDVYGFAQSIKPFLDPNHQRALILGTGGASKAVAHVLRNIGVDVYFVTSSDSKKTTNTFFYSELNEHIMQAFKLIVNTTPLGTFPNVNECPNIPFVHFTAQHLAYDLVYNPAETAFLKQAAAKAAIVVNGLSMLQLQAEKSWEIWNQG